MTQDPTWFMPHVQQIVDQEYSHSTGEEEPKSIWVLYLVYGFECEDSCVVLIAASTNINRFKDLRIGYYGNRADNKPKQFLSRVTEEFKQLLSIPVDYLKQHDYCYWELDEVTILP